MKIVTEEQETCKGLQTRLLGKEKPILSDVITEKEYITTINRSKYRIHIP